MTAAFGNFTPHENTDKQPDAYITASQQLLPTIVFETGSSESCRAILEHKEALRVSGGPDVVVIINWRPLAGCRNESHRRGIPEYL